MLGQFFEVALATPELTASFEFYAALGFRSIPAGDAPHAPAAAFYDGAVTLGVYAGSPQDPVLTFVRPGLREHVRGLRRLGIDLEHAQLADHGVHEVRFADPDGQRVRLIEARSYPPGVWRARDLSACGAFLEYAVPVESLDRSRAFWTELGLAQIAAGAEPHPWARLVGRGVTLGLHAARFHIGLRFVAPNVRARIEYLQAKRLRARHGGPFAPNAPAATLAAPEGTSLYLDEGD